MQHSGNKNRLTLIDKEIDISGSEIIFQEQIRTDNINSIFEFHNSNWSIEEGWLTGKNPEESAGMAIINQDFPGNILLEFESRTVLPSTRDINFMWNTEWDPGLNSCSIGYIGSICGWWTRRAGIEKSPDFSLRATSSNFGFKPGRIYSVKAGSIDGNCFIFINGKLQIELNDPDPINNQKYTKVALSVFSSHVQFRNIIVRHVAWKQLKINYKPEF